MGDEQPPFARRASPGRVATSDGGQPSWPGPRREPDHLVRDRAGALGPKRARAVRRCPRPARAASGVWLSVEPRADADRLQAPSAPPRPSRTRSTEPPAADPTASRNATRRAYYDRWTYPTCSSRDGVEARILPGRGVRRRQGPGGSLDAGLDAGHPRRRHRRWEDRAADQIEIAAVGRRHVLPQPRGRYTIADPSDQRPSSRCQVHLLELSVGDQRRRAGERAQYRYR